MNPYKDVKNLSLIVQPGDSFFPIVTAIDSASHSINMTIFRMDDPVVRAALSNAVNRGVRVCTLVASKSKGWIKRNKKLSNELASMGVEVRSPSDTNGGELKRYHYKILTVDDTYSLILTFNPTQRNLHYARDYGLLIRDHDITIELNRLFNADWEAKEFEPVDTPLVVSPFNSRQRLIELLESGERSIRIMDAKVEDPEMHALLLRKASAGCNVKVITRDAVINAAVPNLHVRRFTKYKLHAKCIVVDTLRFFIGSQNLRGVSLDRRREVGIIVEDEPIARKIERIFDEDWTGAEDLSRQPARQSGG
jgi:phosphatidylserine/phosphatidylglycerophosphate/cardiolipin synthase-like enzyme